MFCPWPLFGSTLCAGRDPPCWNFPMLAQRTCQGGWCGSGCKGCGDLGDPGAASPAVTARWDGKANTRHVLLKVASLWSSNKQSGSNCALESVSGLLYRVVSKADTIILQEARGWGQGYFAKYLCCVGNSSGFLWYYCFRKHLHAFLISPLI